MAAEKERKKGAEIQRQTGEEEGARKTGTNARQEREKGGGGRKTLCHAPTAGVTSTRTPDTGWLEMYFFEKP